ncbi:MAG: hypothetical protein JWO67_3758 [Streptosporangiaceae bacterium]|nr:hypothetical protein [Streptosporangiaceae bacterium]
MDEALDPLDRFWTCYDTLWPLVGAQEAAWWPEGALDALIALKLLVPTTPASQLACPACADRHVEEVQAVRRPDGVMRYYLPCPQNVRVEMDAQLLRQWSPDFQRLARRVKELLNIDGRVREHVPERLWRLGATSWNRRPREAYLARGLCWPDGQTILSRVPAGNRPIVFVGLWRPARLLAEAAAPVVVIPLAAIMSATHGNLSLDLSLLANWTAGADEAADRAGALADHDLKQRVQVYAEQRIDDGGTMNLITALSKQGMSAREAEQEMKKRGHPIDHATIARKRKSIVKALPPPSSGSILRSASSQPRDKHGRPIPDAQPKKE